MPIREISERPRIPIAGTIRLGVREESRSGSEYPRSTEYFVLDDAPNVRKVYGDDPKELDIMFPVADPDKVLPTWFKLWTPSLKKGNKIEQGRLLCRGDGPYESQPGTAIWYDRTREPVSGVLGKRDPVTGSLQRECWGKGCPDAFDDRGNPKCKQTMQVFCILPLVSYGEVYQINTSSWGSIRSFHDWIIWHLAVGGPKYVTSNHYKIVRHEEGTRYFDKKTNTEKSGVQYIMKLEPQDSKEFEQLHGAKLGENKLMFQHTDLSRLLPTAEEADKMPMDELYPMIDVSSSQPATPLTKSENLKSQCEELLNDPEILAAFSALEDAKGIKMDNKQRLLGIRARQSEPDIKKAVLVALYDAAEKSKPKIEDTPLAESLVGPAPEVDETDFGDAMPGMDVTTGEAL